jgi:hypothetical protein
MESLHSMWQAPAWAAQSGLRQKLGEIRKLATPYRLFGYRTG